MAGNRSMRRAMETNDAIRVTHALPLIRDTTEMIDPMLANEMLKHNKRNRPINWRKVEEYVEIMRAGKWELHAQGIVLDPDGNILTGQKRLWAVVMSGCTVPFRVSRGSPASVASLLDRGTPQTARDLAARETERRHSPTESSIARAVAVLRGTPKPSVDELAAIMTDRSDIIARVLKETHGTKKTRALLMILGAIVSSSKDAESAGRRSLKAEQLAERLETALKPETAERCWGKGAAFSLAMVQASNIVEAHE